MVTSPKEMIISWQHPYFSFLMPKMRVQNVLLPYYDLSIGLLYVGTY